MSNIFRAGLTPHEVRTLRAAILQPGALLPKCRLLGVGTANQVKILETARKRTVPSQEPGLIEVYHLAPVELESKPALAKELSEIYANQEYLQFQSAVEETLKSLVGKSTKFQSCQAIFERFALVPALFLAVPALAVGLRFQVPRPVAGDEFGLLGVKNTLSQSLQTDLAKAFPDHAIMPEGVIAPPWKKAHWLVAFGTKFSHSYSRSFLLFLVPKLVSDLRSE